jgi:hypothetical protein
MMLIEIYVIIRANYCHPAYNIYDRVVFCSTDYIRNFMLTSRGSPQQGEKAGRDFSQTMQTAES